MEIDKSLNILKKVDIFKVCLDPYNTKIHNQKQLQLLIKNFNTYDFDEPIVIGTVQGKNPIVVSGNGRVLALKEYCEKNNILSFEVPCVEKDFKSETQRKKYSISKNAVQLETRLDKKKVLQNLFEIKQESEQEFVELLQDDFNCITELQVDTLQPVEELDGEFNNDNVLSLDDLSGFSSQVQKNPYVLYTENRNIYDIPTIKQEYIFNDDIETLISKCDREGCKDDYTTQGKIYELYNYKASAYKRESKNIKMLSFFVYDEDFESIYDEVKAKTMFCNGIWQDAGGRIVDEMIKHNIKIVIEPNFSLLLTEPVVYRLLSTYKQHWCANYFGDFGFKIIPTISVFLDKRTIDMIIDSFNVKSRYAFICGKESAVAFDISEEYIDMVQYAISKYEEAMGLETIFVYGCSQKNINFYSNIKTNKAQIKIIESDKDIVSKLMKNKLNTKHKKTIE